MELGRANGIDQTRVPLSSKSQILRDCKGISGRIKDVRGKANFHSARVGVVCLVLLAQANLLWVAALHRHDEEAAPKAAPAVNGAARQSQPVLETGLICTVCQVVRYSAARPTPSASAPNPAVSALIGFTADPHELTFHRPSVAYGRAPPRG